MIPLRDNVPPSTVPFVNYTIIAITAVVFGAQLLEGTHGARLVDRYGMIPARVTDPERPIVVEEVAVQRTPFGPQLARIEREVEPAAVPPWLTLLTCIFLHGGWLHFLGNMWILYIFGDNVEDRYGHFGYVVFYLLSGAVASATHFLSAPSSEIPTIGASGAIAGVMGAYFLLYPRATIVTLIPIFFFVEVVVLPAFFFLGVWFVLQFFQGALSVSTIQTGGVAWWAHVGGFAAGFLITLILKRARILRPEVTAVRPHTERFSHHRYHRG